MFMDERCHFDVPILFLIFNRPSTTRKVFDAIRKIRPRKLYISADGPRPDRVGEDDACRETREICKEVDWECQVFTFYQDSNLGCGLAVSNGISWFFQNEEMGIILEDDCLPGMSFFRFCESLLVKYKDDERVMQISGTNFLLGKLVIDESYYFSRHSLIWGWATWRRAWEKYDYSLARYKGRDLSGLNSWYKFCYNRVFSGEIDTWDYQWFFSVWFSQGLVVVPKVSLVENIGYGVGSTHTLLVPKWFSRMEYGELDPIVHPDLVVLNKEADDIVFKTVLNNSVILHRSKKILKPIVLTVLKKFNIR